MSSLQFNSQELIVVPCFKKHVKKLLRNFEYSKSQKPKKLWVLRPDLSLLYSSKSVYAIIYQHFVATLLLHPRLVCSRLTGLNLSASCRRQSVIVLSLRKSIITFCSRGTYLSSAFIREGRLVQNSHFKRVFIGEGVC